MYLGVGEYYWVELCFDLTLEVAGEAKLLLLSYQYMATIKLLSFNFFWFSSLIRRFFYSFKILTLNNRSLFYLLKIQFCASISLAIFKASFIYSLTWLYYYSDNFLFFLISTQVFSNISLILRVIMNSIQLHRFSSILYESVLNFSIQMANLSQVYCPQLPCPLIIATWLSYFYNSLLNYLSMQRLRLRQSASWFSASSRFSISALSIDSKLETTFRLSCAKTAEPVLLALLLEKPASNPVFINKFIL